MNGTYFHMEDMGRSRYLRYALYNATNYVCLWGDPTLPPISLKNEQRKNIMLPFITLPRNLFILFLLWRSLDKFSMPRSNRLFHIAFLSTS